MSDEKAPRLSDPQLGQQVGPGWESDPPQVPYNNAVAPACLGRYQIRDRLGSGAFGTVYRAYDPSLDREVALKLPRPGTLGDAKSIERFLREARAAARLYHPNIVPVFEAGVAEGRHFIASAFVNGKDLASVIAEGPMPPRLAARVVAEVAEALDLAHRHGIVHRDVKPANVMLDPSGRPHLTDFGLARWQGSRSSLTHEGAILGTPAYMAPEQAEGRGDRADAASDQYALGVTLYELLCGQVPFAGPPHVVIFNAIHTEPPQPSLVHPGVPRELEAVCLRAMSKEPESRFANCQEMADNLRLYLEGKATPAWPEEEPTPAGRVQFPPRAASPRDRRMISVPVAAGMCLTIAALTLAAALVLGGGKRHDPGPGAGTRPAPPIVAAAPEARSKDPDGGREGPAGEADATSIPTRPPVQEPAPATAPPAQQATDPAASRLRVMPELIAPTGLSSSISYLAVSTYIIDENGDRVHAREDLAPKKKSRLNRGLMRSESPLEPGKKSPISTQIKGMSRLSVDRREEAEATLIDGLLDGSIPTEPGASDGFETMTSAVRVASVIGVLDDRKLREALTDALKLPGQAAVDYRRVEVERQERQTDGSWSTWQLLDGRDNRAWLDRCVGFEEEFAPSDMIVHQLVDPLPYARLGYWRGVHVSRRLPAAGSAEGAGRELGRPPSGGTAAGGEEGAGVTDSPTTRADTLLVRSLDPTILPGKTYRYRARVVVANPNEGRSDVAPGVDTASSELPGPWSDPTGEVTVSSHPDRPQPRTGVAGSGGKVSPPNKTESALTVSCYFNPSVLAFSPDGQRLISAGSGSSTERIGAWDARSGRRLKLKDFKDRWACAAISPDGRTLASDRGELWDDDTGAPLLSLARRVGGVPHNFRCVAFSHDGRRLASGGHDGTVRIWDAETGLELRTINAHAQGVLCVAFSPDGRRVASGGFDRAVKAWDAGSGRELRTFKGHSEYVASVAFSPDGRWIVSGSDDRTMRVWEIETGQERFGHERQSGGIACVAYSPDGRRLASGSYDRIVRLWDAGSGRALLTLDGHPMQVTCVAFSPDSERLASASMDGVVRLWDVTRGE